MCFVDSGGIKRDFQFEGDVDEFLRFLNQDISTKNQDKLLDDSKNKVFDEVWNRHRLHFHASFSTSRRYFIGKLFILIYLALSPFLKATVCKK